MKRFYKIATVVTGDDGFKVKLDGREIKTPEKRNNISPTKALAEAICQEWNDQDDKVVPDSMPVAKLQNTAIDRVATRREDLIAELVNYAGTDMLCYRAEFPEDLAKKQDALWQPLLDWLAGTHGVNLQVTTGILHVAQEANELAKIETLLSDMGSFHLAAFYNITTLCGSVSVALNLLGGNITVEQAWAVAQLDENFQIEQWGIDDEAKIRQDNMKTELDAAARFLELI